MPWTLRRRVFFNLAAFWTIQKPNQHARTRRSTSFRKSRKELCIENDTAPRNWYGSSTFNSENPVADFCCTIRAWMSLCNEIRLDPCLDANNLPCVLLHSFGVCFDDFYAETCRRPAGRVGEWTQRGHSVSWAYPCLISEYDIELLTGYSRCISWEYRVHREKKKQCKTAHNALQLRGRLSVRFAPNQRGVFGMRSKQSQAILFKCSSPGARFVPIVHLCTLPKWRLHAAGVIPTVMVQMTVIRLQHLVVTRDATQILEVHISKYKTLFLMTIAPIKRRRKGFSTKWLTTMDHPIFSHRIRFRQLTKPFERTEQMVSNGFWVVKNG